MNMESNPNGVNSTAADTLLWNLYELTWNNVQHVEQSRDRIYNFYIASFSILTLGAFQLAKIRQESFPDLPRSILILPFLLLFVFGLLTIAIQTRLRMIVNRDLCVCSEIRKVLAYRIPDAKAGLNVLIRYFESRQSTWLHRNLNQGRIVVYLIASSVIFSAGIGSYLAVPVLWFALTVAGASVVVVTGIVLLYEHHVKP